MMMRPRNATSESASRSKDEKDEEEDAGERKDGMTLFRSDGLARPRWLITGLGLLTLVWYPVRESLHADAEGTLLPNAITRMPMEESVRANIVGLYPFQS